MKLVVKNYLALEDGSLIWL